MAEVGWVINTSLSTPNQHFAAWERSGTYSKVHLGQATMGSQHYYTVRNVSGSNNWLWYVDGSSVWEVDMAGWQYGYSLASSERNTVYDSNWSHFWNLQKRDSSGNWYSWGALSQYTDTDPYFYINKISETEHYVQD